MIRVTRLNRTGVVLNSDLIQQIESTPDTVISMTNGERIVVLESPDEVIQRVVEFRRSILNPQSLEFSEPALDQAVTPGVRHGR